MAIVAFVFAFIFALDAGVAMVLARRLHGKPSMYAWVASMVGIIQALALGLAGFYPEVGSVEYIVLLICVGLMLQGILVVLSVRSARKQ